MSQNSGLEEISRLVSLRSATDGRIDAAFAVSGIASWAWWAAYLLEAWFGFFSTPTGLDASFLRSLIGLLALLSTVPLAYLIYKIINRRNEHFGRSEAFLGNVIGMLGINAQPAERAIGISNAQYEYRGLVWKQKERSAYLLSLLILFPLSLVSVLDRAGWPFVFVGWSFVMYALHAVTKDFVQHERAEFLTLAGVQIGLGIPTPSIRGWHIDGRSLRYLLLSIFTLGLFALAWLYIAIHDPEPHFQIQSQLETNIYSSLLRS